MVELRHLVPVDRADGVDPLAPAVTWPLGRCRVVRHADVPVLDGLDAAGLVGSALELVDHLADQIAHHLEDLALRLLAEAAKAVLQDILQAREVDPAVAEDRRLLPAAYGLLRNGF